MQKGIDLYLPNWEHVGRIVVDGASVEYYVKNGFEQLKETLNSYLRSIIDKGVWRRYSEQIGNTIVERGEHIDVTHDAYWDAVRDKINDDGGVGDYNVRALPCRSESREVQPA